MMNLTRMATASAWGLALAGTLAMTAAGQSPPPPASPQKAVSAQKPSPPKKQWTATQVLPFTCAQAWVEGGKSYHGLYAIVETMATVSLANRDLAFPDTKEAGLDAGNGIAADCKADPDGLLYAMVDKHVRRVAEAAAAGK